MQITSIKPSKIPNRVWVTFSDHSFIPFFIDDVVKLSLKSKKEIDGDNFCLIIKTCLIFIGREYALRQIAISPKVEKILKQKLNLFFRKAILKYKINVENLNLSEIGQEIVQELKDKKLLNELDFINYFIKRNQRKPSQQIIFLLRQYGIGQDLLSSITFDQQSDLDKIKNFLDKKKIDKLKLSDFNEKNKIKATLYRRGFNLSDINIAIDEWLAFR